MSKIHVLIDQPEPIWPDLHGREVLHVPDAKISLASLTNLKAEKGKTGLAFRLDLENNQTVLAEVGLETFLAAADALRERFDT